MVTVLSLLSPIGVGAGEGQLVLPPPLVSSGQEAGTGPMEVFVALRLPPAGTVDCARLKLSPNDCPLSTWFFESQTSLKLTLLVRTCPGETVPRFTAAW